REQRIRVPVADQRPIIPRGLDRERAPQHRRPLSPPWKAQPTISRISPHIAPSTTANLRPLHPSKSESAAPAMAAPATHSIPTATSSPIPGRSEEHTSELQSRE